MAFTEGSRVWFVKTEASDTHTERVIDASLTVHSGRLFRRLTASLIIRQIFPYRKAAALLAKT